MNAASILSIPADEPERLFKSKDNLKSAYFDLLKFWHPDRNSDPEASHVVSYIQDLYKSAQEKVENNIWNPPGVLMLSGTDGKTRNVKYRASGTFELGKYYLGDTLLTFTIPKAHESLVLSGLRCIGTIRYPTEDFRQHLESYFPKVEHYIETKAYFVIILRKTPGEVLLSDLLKHLGGQMTANHTAWIMSRLFNLASFLQVNQMTHNGITPDSLLIDPERHSASLLGGWWYAAPYGKNVSTLPPEVFKLASRKFIATKKADPMLDLDSIRNIGRVCLGDGTGNSFRTRKDLPECMASFLQLPSSSNAVEEYEKWIQVLKASFGPRKFVEMKVSAKDVYPKEEIT
jgi:hypothetical protein